MKETTTESIIQENKRLKDELKEIKNVGRYIYSIIFWMENDRAGNESIHRFKELVFKKEE
jgi:hypothetical protein|tara:strand:- start:73 stop:252 length:180 start_codon:yes stop_codon:yes gene_type:complete